MTTRLTIRDLPASEPFESVASNCPWCVVVSKR